MENSGGEPTDAPPSYAVESVMNAARILLMLRSASELHVGAVSEELGVARSTAHRLLTTLQSQGLLHQPAARRAYTPGPALVELGARVVGAMDLRGQARPVLERLAEKTGETTHLLILRGDEVVFVDGVDGRHAIRAATRIGAFELAHVSAAGKVLLAELPLAELHRRYPRKELTGGTDGAVHTRTALERELAEVRERGYAVNDSESEAGLCAVSVALRDVGGLAVGAVSVSGPSARMSDRVSDIAGALREALSSRAD
ncbi:IclR family transcriptional regulator (plasmid) [Herbiconiux sp. KACC 21604]|uniref:IclR family transcriptional regulator n=1 Tax=unclassified Herbiconiux TaxID=2618217 RepID=UPI0014928C21|nr:MULTISPECIES: IclR family transcriptional regulator [unclassified Herbiconiux]QJU56312.1 IclR family transcriptional regulator [Herbiconiux sp. SALV-R1]WPO88819.1 IclR family transcriptional regulator [Herbiconiux sp. KACC 21604]